MPYNYVIDTFAWVEYLIGSPKGKKAKEYIEGRKAATPSIVLLEIRKWYMREIESKRRTIENMNKTFDFVESITQIIDLDTAMAKKAGEIDFLMKKQIRGWPITDSIVYAAAKESNALVVTGDQHFKSLEGVVLL